MLPNRAMRAQIGTLIIATSCIQIGNGFFGTFISLRVALEDFEAAAAGFVLSSYFVGFTSGALRCGNIIARVGHIRAYAAFAGLAVAATAAMPLLIGPLPWLVLRGVIGRHVRHLVRGLSLEFVRLVRVEAAIGHAHGSGGRRGGVILILALRRALHAAHGCALQPNALDALRRGRGRGSRARGGL